MSRHLFLCQKTGISNVNARERSGTLFPVCSYKMGVISGESGGLGYMRPLLHISTPSSSESFPILE